ncbi:MAG: hypothetical protein ACKV2Q_31830 [Planctomycetaceae bacterium]
MADWLGGLKYEWLQSRLVSVDGVQLNTLTQEKQIQLVRTELATTFVKLGQILSTRPDLLPEPLVTELSQLQANTPPDSSEASRTKRPTDLVGENATTSAGMFGVVGVSDKNVDPVESDAAQSRFDLRRLEEPEVQNRVGVEEVLGVDHFRSDME